MSKNISSPLNSRVNSSLSLVSSFMATDGSQLLALPSIGLSSRPSKAMTPGRLSAIINEAMNLIDDEDFDFSSSGEN